MQCSIHIDISYFSIHTIFYIQPKGRCISFENYCVCVNILTHRCHCILFIHIFIVKSCCEMYIYLHLRIMKIHCMSKCKGSHNITSGSFFLLSKHRIYYIFYLILSLFIYKIRHSRNCIKFNLFCKTLIISLIHTKSG